MELPVLAPRALGALQSSQQLMRHLAAWASSDAPAVGPDTQHHWSRCESDSLDQLKDGWAPTSE